MNRSRFVIGGLAAVFTAAGSIAVAQAQQPAKDPKPAAPKAANPQAPAGQQPQAEHALPPGWTEADMQACMVAGTPGPMHAYLAKGIGVWTGKTTMWMAPGMEPMQSTCTSTVTGLMDGRYTKVETAGDMPGMGPFSGLGIYAFDNVAQQFQSTWIDNCGTGIGFGTGELSSDGKTMTWKITYNCPITKKPTTLREIERVTGKDSKTMEMYGIDPKSGKEFKMMVIDLTRSPGGAQASALSISNRHVEAGCAKCVYGMPGVKGCKLAVKVDGTPYLASGTDQVDAHQFCSGAKPVIVSGHIEDEWFVVSAFEVLPVKR